MVLGPRGPGRVGHCQDLFSKITDQNLLTNINWSGTIINDVSLLGSSMVEHPAVNRVVAGSSPARGANFIITIDRSIGTDFFYFFSWKF